MKNKAHILLAIAAVSLALALPAALSAGDAVKIRVTADRVNIRQAADFNRSGRRPGGERARSSPSSKKKANGILIQLEDGTPGYIHSFTVEEVVEGQAPPAKKPAAAPGGRQIQVTADRANIRKAATLTAPLIRTAEKGRDFADRRKKGEWYLIQIEDGTPGYIHSFTVAEIAGGEPSPAGRKTGGETGRSRGPSCRKVRRKAPVEKPVETPRPPVQVPSRRPPAPRGP